MVLASNIGKREATLAFLLALTCTLIIYGTLYSFNFSASPYQGDTFSVLMTSLESRPGHGDILSNVVLFLPFGFFSMQCLMLKSPRLIRLLLVVTLGTALSLTIECVQIYLPSRVTSVYDIALNAFGTLSGAFIGWLNWREQLSRLQDSGRQVAMFPLLVLAAWLGYRLFPYAPTIDFQHFKNALKPILSADLPPLDMLRHFIVTLVVGRLLQGLATPNLARLGVIVIALGAIAAKPFIVTKSIQPAELAGVIAGVAVWVFILSRWHRNTAIVAILLVVQVVIQGMSPWSFSLEPKFISFVPFIGFEGGSMSVNLQAFLEKVFLYGALIWLLVETGRRLFVSLTLSVVILTAVELMQMFLVNRTSEITDPMLALILGMSMYSLDLRARPK